MKRIILLLGITAFMLCLAQPSLASLNQFAGKWKNVDQNTRGLTTLKIGVRGDKVTVQAWGSCHPKDCDWGKVKAIPYGPGVSANLSKSANALSAVYKENFKITRMIIKPKGNRLRAEVYSHFTKGDRTDYNAVYSFKKEVPGGRPPVVREPEIKEDCISFNPKTATVKNMGGRWKIVDGSHLMFDFEGKENDARKALNIIKRYRMNQSCFVGRPGPSLQYMLVSGKAPIGAYQGEDCISFNPKTITVKNINGRWKIVDGSHWMFDFEDKEAEARQAFSIIKRHGFNNSCFVGRPNAKFQYMTLKRKANPLKKRIKPRILGR